MTVSKVRANLARAPDQVVGDRTGLVVTRRAGDVVLVARDEYDSLIETPICFAALPTPPHFIESALATPSAGVGEPERLRGSLSGCWSRRIRLEHRLVYEVRDGLLIVHQCRFHY